MNVIDIHDVWKTYRGGVQALGGISLQVPQGQIFGFLGPNGAGKSTLVKVLTSIVKPNKCQGTMLGMPIGHKPTLAKVGYLPEHARFPEYLKGREVIQYVAGLSGVPKSRARVKADELLELVGMSDWANKKMGTYSKGMKQRIGLAQALVNDPEIVFLDEPTDGVDPRGRKEMRDVLEKMRDQGRTVFINSHLLGELEMICDSVAIMDRGTLVTQGSIAELTAKSQRIELDYQGSLSPDLTQRLHSMGAESAQQTLTIYQKSIPEVQSIIDALRKEQVTIARVQEVRQNLEDFFISSVSTEGVGGTQN